MKKFASFLFSILVLSSSLCLADYLRVGNGGEGYLVLKTLYTRDLFEYDIHKTPWFGDQEDYLLKHHIQDWNPLQLSVKEHRLLVRKLTDLNRAQAFLGDDILAALQFFQWRYVDDALHLIEPDEVRRVINPDLRVPIANRLFQSILINKAHFQRLDAENKIALILHEAIYALIKPRYYTGRTNQSLSLTRQIVAGFFSEDTVFVPSFLSLLSEALNIEALHQTQFRPLVGGSYKVTLESSRSIRSYSMDLPEHYYKWKFEEYVEDACRGFFLRASHLSKVSFTQNARRTLSTQTYEDNNGLVQYAVNIKNAFDSKPVTYNFSITNKRECVRQLLPLFSGPQPWDGL